MKLAKKGFYLVYGSSFGEKKNEEIASGIKKKILDQIEALNLPNTIECELIILNALNANPIWKLFSYLMIDQFKNCKFVKESIDFIYIRRFVPNSFGLIKLLSRVKKNNPQCKILYEIPTYPYDLEHKSRKEKIVLLIDILYRRILYKYIDRIVTLSKDDNIFGIKTIKIINGIKCSNIPIVKNKKKLNGIHLVALAQFQYWHGYDRLIEGLNEYYYNNNREYDIFIHFIGDGNELKLYKLLVSKYHLDNRVLFHGLLNGDELANIFNMADIGVGSLAAHRKKLFISSELKSREYFSRGLPIVLSAKLDCVADNFKYCYNVPEDESPINMLDVIEFFKGIYLNNNRNWIVQSIRNYAEQTLDISVTMQPIIKYIASSNLKCE